MALRKVSMIMPGAVQRIKIFTPYPGSLVFQKAVEDGYHPPETLEKWGKYTREYSALPYITNHWWYKTISYVTYFTFYSKEQELWGNKPKLTYRLIITIFKILSFVRWNTRFFALPLEFIALDIFRKISIKIMK